MQGTIVKVAVEEGQEVKEGDLVVVLEAMKMEQPFNAHRSGIIKPHRRSGRVRRLGRRHVRNHQLNSRGIPWHSPAFSSAILNRSDNSLTRGILKPLVPPEILNIDFRQLLCGGPRGEGNVCTAR